MPFHGTKGRHLVFSIVNGTRPTKPEDATVIGLSDPLWELLQACWSGDRTQRPRIRDVEVQVGGAATRWEIPVLSRGSVPFPRHPGDSQDTSITPSRSSSTKTRNSSASDLSRLHMPVIRVVGADENNSNPMQEFYPPPSPISSSPPGSPSDEALINRLDSVSP